MIFLTYFWYITKRRERERERERERCLITFNTYTTSTPMYNDCFVLSHPLLSLLQQNLNAIIKLDCQESLMNYFEGIIKVFVEWIGNSSGCWNFIFPWDLNRAASELWSAYDVFQTYAMGIVSKGNTWTCFSALISILKCSSRDWEIKST
jgi:hypothetical protein